MAAAFDQVIALLELLLPEVAGHHRSAVSIHATGEVLAGEADARPLPVLQLTLINKIPFRHAQSTQCPGNSAPVLLPRREWMQHVQQSLEGRRGMRRASRSQDHEDRRLNDVETVVEPLLSS